MSLYTTIRRCYHFVPESVRHSLYRGTPTVLMPLRRRLVQSLEATAEHDEIYDAAYYAKIVEPTMELSAEAMARSIQRTLRPKTVADVGCGTGRLLEALALLGCRVQGYEYSEAALQICKERGLNVQKFDIENDPLPSDRVDLVISTEVAEHLPETCADRFVALLTALAQVVVLTAAIPGQGGTDHVNEQPNEYWIAKFMACGYRYDRTTAEEWRREWRARGVAHCFANSVMVLREIL